jgi:hypothetical protein
LDEDKDRRGRPASAALHRYVYVAIAGFAFWFILAAWEFARDPYTDYLLTIVSGLILIFVAIPFVLSRVGREEGDGNQPESVTFRRWASGDFDTWQYRVKAKNAAAEILLPLVAAAVGMTAFGVVLYLTAHHIV